MITRIILADDHQMIREGLKNILSGDKTLRVVGEVSDGDELLNLLEKSPCDCVILDLSMPRVDGLTTIPEIKKLYPKIKIVIFTLLADTNHFKYAMAQGASGYIAKGDASQEILTAIRVLKSGKQYVSPSVTTLLTDRLVRSDYETDSPSPKIMTGRESQVLKLIAQGMASKNIAAKLKISIRTVENHRFNLSEKLGIKNTANLVRYAITKGLA